MPFRSKRQQRYMFAAEARGELKPGTAREWAAETDFSRLPEKVRKRVKKRIEKASAVGAGAKITAARLLRALRQRKQGSAEGAPGRS